MTKPTTPRKTKKKSAYHLTITMGDRAYEIDTDDLKEALLHYTDSPMTIKSKVFFKVTKGEKVFERMVLPRMARRYLAVPNFASVFARNIDTFLK